MRSGSASRENQQLRDNIGTLKQELMQSQAQNARVQDQLNCLILLVKRCVQVVSQEVYHVY